MTADAVNVPPQKHPVPAMTTYELADYRRELEHALTALPGHVAVRDLLQDKLAGVLAEQDARAKIARGTA